MSQEQLEEFAGQIHAFEERLQQVEQHLSELAAVAESVRELSSVGEGELLVPLGAGVFSPANLQQERKLFMNVGAGVVVEKDASEAVALIRAQMDQLEQFRVEVQGSLDELRKQMQAFRE